MEKPVKKPRVKKAVIELEKLKPVIVLWKDIVGVNKSWIDMDDVKHEHSHPCQRLCYLVEETEEEIYFVAGSSQDGSVEELSVMPRGAVKQIIPIAIPRAHMKKILKFLKDGSFDSPKLIEKTATVVPEHKPHEHKAHTEIKPITTQENKETK